MWGLLAVFAFLVVAVVYLTFGFDESRPLLSGLIMLPAAVALLTPVIRWTASGEERLDLRGLLYLGLAGKLLGAVFRYKYLAADSLSYHREGVRIAQSLRHFEFGVDTGRQVPGTGTVRYLAGVIQVLVFDQPFASFVVATSVSFVGICFFVKAFRVGFPEGDIKRYALLVCLLPSLLFWPSSLGKEALMAFGIGLVSLGVAHLFHGGWWKAAIALSVGLAASGMVRPHVALITVVGLAGAVLLPRTHRSKIRTGTRLLALCVVLIGGPIMIQQTATLFSKDDSTGFEIEETLDRTEDQTEQGGSQFTPVRVRTPANLPLAVVTVYFRPLPHEARDFNAMLSAGETVLLVAIAIVSIRRYKGLWGVLKRNPYVAYALATVLAFAFAFSAIANFGILARQRSQAFPLLLILFAMPATTGSPKLPVGANLGEDVSKPRHSTIR